MSYLPWALAAVWGLFVTAVRSISNTSRSKLTTSFQIRFDPVYIGHFKRNLRDIRHGYANIYL
jgi:glutathionyl-hydroquinone reductase